MAHAKTTELREELEPAFQNEVLRGPPGETEAFNTPAQVARCRALLAHSGGDGAAALSSEGQRQTRLLSETLCRARLVEDTLARKTRKGAFNVKFATHGRWRRYDPARECQDFATLAYPSPEFYVLNWTRVWLRRREIGQILIGRRKFIGGFYGASEIFLRPRKTKV
jgi:hypothetical protein